MTEYNLVFPPVNILITQTKLWIGYACIQWVCTTLLKSWKLIEDKLSTLHQFPYFLFLPQLISGAKRCFHPRYPLPPPLEFGARWLPSWVTYKHTYIGDLIRNSKVATSNTPASILCSHCMSVRLSSIRSYPESSPDNPSPPPCGCCCCSWYWAWTYCEPACTMFPGITCVYKCCWAVQGRYCRHCVVEVAVVFCSRDTCSCCWCWCCGGDGCSSW